MAKIIAFANQKGGIGKTQCTVLSASAFAALGKRVVVLDMDPQASIITARKFDDVTDRKAFAVESIRASELSESLPALDQTTDFIFIDLPGKLDIDIPVNDQAVTRALMYLDYLFIPFVAGNYNLESSLHFLTIARRIESARNALDRKLNLIGFVNMYRNRSRVNDYLIQDIEKIQDKTGLAFMREALKYYATFADTDTVTSLHQPGAKDAARANFTAWFNELEAIVNNKHKKRRNETTTG
jgi:chromosome partitioning protein